MISPAAKMLSAGSPFVISDARPLVDLQSEVRERDAGPQRVAPERRRVERPAPSASCSASALRCGSRRAPRGRTSPGRTARLNASTVRSSASGDTLELTSPARESSRAAIGGNTDGMNRPRDFGIDDRIGDLIGLLRDEASPDRVALRPEVLALVVEAFGMRAFTTMPSETQSSRVTMPPSNFGARASIATQWNCVRIADRLRAGVEHQLQHRARVVRRAAHDEVVGRRRPRFPSATRGSTRIRRPRARPPAPRSVSTRPSIVTIDGRSKRPSSMSRPTTSAS